MARLIRNASFLGRSLFQCEGYRRGILGTYTQICNFSTKGKKKSTKSSDGSDSSEKKLSKKELALQQALGQITTTFGKGSIMWLGRSASSKNVPVVSTGSFSLDMALGVGGFPKGRVVEIYGPEASGKTTLALHVIAESQKQGGRCVFVDAEHSFDPALAQAIGVNTENLQLSQPGCGEEALSFVDTLIRSGSVDVVVVNSVAALVPKGELDGEMGDGPIAMQSRLMSQVLRKLCHSLFLSQTILIFINQVRPKPSTFGGFDGATEVTCGGNAVKFYASVRLYVRRIGYVKKGEEAIGSQVQVKVVKNKLAPPFRIAQFELEFGKGICKESEIIDLGLKHNFMSQAASFYRFNGRSFCGKDALKSFLSENEDAREELITKLREKLLITEMGKPQNGDETEGSFHEDIITPPDSTDEDTVTTVEVMKNKLAPPFRNAQFEFEKGICKETEIIDLGLKYNFISKGGPFFRFNSRSFHGKDAFKTFLSKNEDAREELITKLREKLLDAEMGKPRNVDETEGSLQEDIIAQPDSRNEDAVTAVEVMKNKLAPPFRNAQFELEFEKGICKETEIIDLGLKYNFISKGGPFFRFNGRSFHGKDAFKTFLSKNEDVRKELITKLQEKLLDTEMDKRQNGDETEGSLQEDVITPSDSTDEDAVTAVEA